MEIGNKILELRKKKGMSQEQLAEKMEVARQTISKWELGETSPDLAQAKKLSAIFKVSLDELVNNDVKEIVVEKVSSIEKLAGMIIFIIKIGIGFFVGMVFLTLIALIAFSANRKDISTDTTVSEEINCTVDKEEYKFSIVYKENNGKILEYDLADANFINGAQQITDVYELKDYIENAIKEKGGTCDFEQ